MKGSCLPPAGSTRPGFWQHQGLSHLCSPVREVPLALLRWGGEGAYNGDHSPNSWGSKSLQKPLWNTLQDLCVLVYPSLLSSVERALSAHVVSSYSWLHGAPLGGLPVLVTDSLWMPGTCGRL